jgi:hypothetical protein
VFKDMRKKGTFHMSKSPFFLRPPVQPWNNLFVEMEDRSKLYSYNL